MNNLLRFFLSIQLKHSKRLQQVNGFTLIELLVGLLLAFLVITPLLTFMISILSTDQKEQAKANSEQEIQSAVDYIARDLQQAVYIYDRTALITNSNTVAASSGIKNQIPPVKKAGVCDSSDTTVTCQPILVFWKRKFIPNVITPSSTTTSKDDTFVYSLVAYYLIKDNNTTWSKAARIARFEISDGVLAVSGSPNCNTTDYPNDTYIDTSHCPDSGFQRFNLNLPGAAGITNKMNSWKTASLAYTQTPVVLIDFVDQTAIATDPTCPVGTLSKGSFMGFYACIDVPNTTAQVFLRGNALARLQSSNFDYSSNNQTYFPTASVRVQGRGYLFTR
ncbi:MAG: hormogonium polysaccharide secretion pseudopilin HpsC [Nostoc sp.]|uniref:hormogonium polysaccharide secretion pseudopilin HpsC n=1 Tax=Nostoc sp. TaxID=1180 RepID=UPI002FF57D7F